MPQYHTVNPDAMTNLASQAAERAARRNGGEAGKPAKNEWLQLDEGDHLIRIAPPWSDEGVVVRTMRRHQGFKNSKGWQVFPLSYDFIMWEDDEGEQPVANYLIEAGKLTEEDLDLYDEYGCPLKILPKTLLEEAGEDKEKRKAFSHLWPKTRHIWNVVYVGGPNLEDYDGRIVKWGTSETLFQKIIANFKMDPTLADPNKGRALMLGATGPRTRERRYNFNGFAPNPTKLKVKKGEAPFDLDEEMAKGAYSYRDLVRLIVNNNEKYPLEQRVGDLAKDERVRSLIPAF